MQAAPSNAPSRGVKRPRVDDDDADDDQTGSAVLRPRRTILSQYSRDVVDSWPRDKILLMIRDLPPGPSPAPNDSWLNDPTVKDPVVEAFSRAYGVTQGPQAVMDLTRLGADADCGRVFGNREAGDLIAAIEQEVNRRVDARTQPLIDMVATLRSQLPIDYGNSSWTSGALARLAPDRTDAGWIYDLLRSATASCLDTRIRNLRVGSRWNAAGASALSAIRNPNGINPRIELINGLVHAGNLRLDAFLCEIEFGRDRHGSQHYNTFLRDAFRHVYGMSSVDALWLETRGLFPAEMSSITLAKHVVTVPSPIRWNKYLVAINLYVYARNLMLQGRGLYMSPMTYQQIHTNYFEVFIATVTDLINFVRSFPDSAPDPDLIATATQQANDLEIACELWLDPTNLRPDEHNNPWATGLWYHFENMPAWAPTDFLQITYRDGRTASWHKVSPESLATLRR